MLRWMRVAFAQPRLNHLIQIFDSSDNDLANRDNKGSGNGQFSFPEDGAFDSWNKKYGSDKGNHLVHRSRFV